MQPEALITGVFAFLDAALSPQQRDLARQDDLATVRSYQKRWWDSPDDSIDIWVQKVIHETFRLQYLECPLRKALKPFRLYHREDMADALAHAYFLHMTGEDPLEAMRGDYVLKPHGLLYWMSWDEMETGNDHERKVRNEFFRFHEPGDRVLSFRTMAYSGYLLVRGDRLVWDLPGAHFTVTGRNPRFDAECQEFERLGGNREFLEGRFIWPPEGWVSPISDEDGRR